MKRVPAIIQYKAKIRTIHNADNTTSQYIDYKKALTRRDCNLKPHMHDYFNSDMFVGMLNGAHKAAIGGREWCRLEDMPAGVTVNTSGFLATVTIQVEV